MRFSFHKKRVSGILTILPANERKFLDEMKNFNFPESRSLKLKQIMGFDTHRIVEKGVCSSDLVVCGFEYLFAHGFVRPDDIDALILVTMCPDHFTPPTSNVIQGRLHLKRDLFCLDINQGCAGFVVGLIQAFMMLEQDSITRVAVANADVISRKVSSKDRNVYPLIGDGASITIVEKDTASSSVYANLKMDGTQRDVLIIPAGGFRLPSSPETAVLEDAGDNNFRSKDNLYMDGASVFNFVQVEVPPMISDLMDFAKVSSNQVHYYFFHQPNRFMLQKLAEKMKVPPEKMPSNVVEHFGNSSGVTIPTVITFNFRDRMLSESYMVCLAGFGVGLTWASMLMQLGPLEFCEMIDYQN